MITISTSPNGIRLTRDGDSYTAIGPASLRCLITKLATRPAATPAQLGMRLADARRRYLVESR
jgi:hypothetical protein